MKLNINSKELLALHNLLHARFENDYDGKLYADDDPRGPSDAQLRQVYNRLKAVIVAALSNNSLDPIDAFLSHEQAKIDKLKGQNEDIKKETKAAATDPDFWTPDEALPDYPRRGPRNRHANKGNQKR